MLLNSPYFPLKKACLPACNFVLLLCGICINIYILCINDFRKMCYNVIPNIRVCFTVKVREKKVNNEELLQLAKEASQNAYAKYSNFQVGACAIYESGKTYKGCNVENGSFPLCLCAERNAMSTAIASGEKTKLKAVAIYSPKTKLCWPCGACRQWFSEFEQGQNIKIILEGKDGSAVEYSIDDVIPNRFELIQ